MCICSAALGLDREEFAVEILEGGSAVTIVFVIVVGAFGSCW